MLSHQIRFYLSTIQLLYLHEFLLQRILLIYCNREFQKNSNLVLGQKSDQNLQIVFHEVPLILRRFMF
jgi:hypothetical protein